MENYISININFTCKLSYYAIIELIKFKGDYYMTLSKEERSWVLYDCGNSAYSMAVTTALLPFNSVFWQLFPYF